MIYSPNILRFYQELAPGESREDTWDQTDDAGKQVNSGSYTICTQWGSIQIHIEAVEEIITVTTDKVNYGVGEDVIITFTNDGNEAVLFYPEWVEDVDGKIVRSPRVLLYPLVLEPGDSTVNTWDQRDDHGKLVEPGQYTIRTLWDSIEIDIMENCLNDDDGNSVVKEKPDKKFEPRHFKDSARKGNLFHGP